MPENENLAVDEEYDNVPDVDAQMDNGLTEAQNRAILALISNSTISETAKRIGVNRSTIHRWMRDLDFRREYLETRTRAFSAAVGRAQRMSDGAVERLGQIIRDSSTDSVRLSAIRLALDFAARGIELDNFDLRIATLEDIAAKNEQLNQP